MIKWIKQISNWKILILLIFLFLVTVSVLIPLVEGWLNVPRSGVEKIDTLFTYSSQKLDNIVSAYDAQGRSGYAIGHLTVDVFFPLVYLLMFLVAFNLTWGFAFPQKETPRWLFVFPFLMAGLDLLENITLSIILFLYPPLPSLLGVLAGPITLLKWIASGSIFLVLIILVLLGIIRLIRR